MNIEDKKVGLGDLLTEAGELSFGWEGDGSSAGEADEEVSVLSFRVGNDFFGLETSHVREIVGSAVLTPLPGAPEHIRGIVVLRRQVVGVLDLGTFLGLEPDLSTDNRAGLSGEDVKSRTVIVESGKYVAGIHVDQVDGLEMWAKRQVDSEGVVGKRVQRYVRMGCDQDGVLKVLLDLERLLDDAAVR